MENDCRQITRTDTQWAQSYTFKKGMVNKKDVNFVTQYEEKQMSGIQVSLGYRRFYSNGKINDKNSIVTFIPLDNAKLLRDWLVEQVPFSKQELVDLMGEVSK